LLPSSSGRIRGGRSEHERSVPTKVEGVCMKPTSTLRGYQRHRLLVDPEQCAARFLVWRHACRPERISLFNLRVDTWTPHPSRVT
jgi:hypothetical protein